MGDRFLYPISPLRETLAPREAHALLAIGPEGGWTPYEAEELRGRGFEPFTLGAHFPLEPLR